MANEVKFMHSGMTGAPTLSGVAGALVSLLDTCLVNGFGAGTVDSVVVSGGIATVTRSGGHPFEVGSIGEIAGATPSGLNGQKRILTVPSASTYTFDATGVASGTATGTITHKVAAAGWTKEFSGTNLAAYKSPNVAATGCLLRVDDTGTTVGRVVGYETMSDVNTGTGPFPTSAQVSGGAYVGKSATGDSTTRAWILFADDRGVYLSIQHSGTTSYSTYFFGDILSAKSPDPYSCALAAWSANNVGSTPGSITLSDVAYADVGTNTNMWLARGASGLGGSQATRRSATAFVGSTTFSGGGGAAYPNPADNGLYLFPMHISENPASPSYRGMHPGAYYCPQAVGTGTIASRESITGVTNLSGRTLKAVLNASGPLFVDITGPWR